MLVYTIVKERLKCGSIEEAVMNTMHRIEGAYSLVVMSPRKLIAARDPHGFRPLCIGLLDNDCYIFRFRDLRSGRARCKVHPRCRTR